MKYTKVKGVSGEAVAVVTLRSGKAEPQSLLSGVVERADGPILFVDVPAMGQTWRFDLTTGERNTKSGAVIASAHLLGPWLTVYGHDDVLGPDNVAAALQRAERERGGAVDNRGAALAAAVVEVCDLFGITSAALGERPVADSKDPTALAHNSLRKFAVGALVHLAAEVDEAFAATAGETSLHGRRSIAMIPALEGVHRGTLATFLAQFVALTGLGEDARGRKRTDADSGVGRFVRESYARIRQNTVQAVTGVSS